MKPQDVKAKYVSVFREELPTPAITTKRLAFEASIKFFIHQVNPSIWMPRSMSHLMAKHDAMSVISTVTKNTKFVSNLPLMLIITLHISSSLYSNLQCREKVRKHVTWWCHVTPSKFDREEKEKPDVKWLLAVSQLFPPFGGSKYIFVSQSELSDMHSYNIRLQLEKQTCKQRS